MKTQKEIEEALKEMETRKSSYLLDMASYKEPKDVVYDTELIRKLEVTDATIHALKWALYTKTESSNKKENIINQQDTCISSSCFWRHKWTKWEQYSQPMIARSDGQQYIDYRQRRTCIRCGKMQDELVS